MIELSGNIIDYIRENFGEDFLSRYREYYNSEYNPYLRTSAFTDKPVLIEQLKKYGIELLEISGVPNAYRILSGADVAGKTLEFILGKYYIQSLSSMIPALVLNPNETDTVLDLCAAPGSKTTQLAEMMNNKGTLIANELSMDRLKSLVFNIDKMNLVNVGVLHGKGELLSKQFENRFDKILVDAPCSALGIVQKKGEVSNWWDLRKAESISDLQLRLLIAAIKMCKVDGEIVYSTCTLTLEENERVLNTVLKKYPVELEKIKLPVKSHGGFTKIEDEELNPLLNRAQRIYPWEVESEGFFVSKLRKTDLTEPTEKIHWSEKKIEFVKSSSGKIKNYLERLSNHFGIPIQKFTEYKYFFKSNDVGFINASWESDHLDSFNRIGTRFGTIDKHGNLILNSLAVQTLGGSITKNMYAIESKAELETYFNGGTIKKNFEKGGQRAVMFDGYILGSGSASKEGLKSQFPRAFRTQEIILPEF